MWIIEIEPLENGAHRNQSGKVLSAPEGWAYIPDDLEIPDTFPFVELTVEGDIVTGMTPGVVPTPEPAPEPTPVLADRVAALEDAIAKGLTLYEEGLQHE